MSALMTVMRGELRRLGRDPALLGLAVTLVVLAGLAAWTGARFAAEREQALAVITQEMTHQKTERREQLVAEGEAAPMPARAAWSQAWRPTLPTAPLSALAVGQAENWPISARVSAGASTDEIFDEFRTGTDNPALLAAGRFDLAFLVVWLVPLFVLAACYDMWAAERVRGRSGLLLSRPVSPRTFLLGKALVRGGLAALAASSIVTLAAALASGPRLTAIAGIDLLTVFVLVSVWSLFWVFVALAVNVFARAPAQAAVASGAVWLLIVVVIPSVLTAGLDLAAPKPSEPLLAAERRAGLVASQARGDAVLQDFMRTEGMVQGAVNDAPVGPRRNWAVRERAEATFALAVTAHRAAEDRRRRLSDILRFGSPAVLIQDSLERLAGTDADRAQAWRAQVRRFLIEDVRGFVRPRLFEGRFMTLAEFDDLPEFRFVETPSSAGAPILANLGLLVLLSALALFIGLFAATPARLARRDP